MYRDLRPIVVSACWARTLWLAPVMSDLPLEPRSLAVSENFETERSSPSARYVEGFKPALHWDLIDAPLAWSTPRFVFVNSMSDLFQRCRSRLTLFVWMKCPTDPQ